MAPMRQVLKSAKTVCHSLSRSLRTIQCIQAVRHSGRQWHWSGSTCGGTLLLYLRATRQCSLWNGIIYHLQAAILRRPVQWEDLHCQWVALTCLKVLPVLRLMVIMDDRSYCTSSLKLCSVNGGIIIIIPSLFNWGLCLFVLWALWVPIWNQSFGNDTSSN